MATRILTALVVLTLVWAVACGSAAPEPTAMPDPTATPAADAAPAAEPTAAPVVSDTPQPTAVPQVAEPPADVEVNPGKLTVMVGDLGDGRLDPALAAPGGGGYNLARLLGGFLISDNEKKEMIPGIANQWDLSNDGLTLIFTIREGMKFHDGSDLTAQDVHWTLDHYYGPGAEDYMVSTSTLSMVRRMESIDLSGPGKVTLNAKEFISNLATNLSEADDWNHIMPKRTQLYDEQEALAYDRNPIGAGPMRLVSFTPAYVWNFERFDDYYYQPKNGLPEDRRVKFQSLDMFLVPEEATRVAALRSGEADIVPASLATKQQVEAGGGRIVFSPEGLVSHVRLLACYDPQYPCHDKRVRQALTYALDKELMRDQLYGGPDVFQIKGWDVVTPSSIGYTPGLDPLPFDPEKARQLLADAGYPNGEGFGKLIVNTYPSTALPFVVESAQLASDMWKRELGLDVEVRASDSVGVKKMERSGELNGQILWRDNETGIDGVSTNRSSYGTPDHTSRLHERPELFEMGEQAMAETDPTKIEEALNSWYRTLREEQYELGIGYVNIPWAVSPRVLTWEPYPLAFFPSAYHTITLEP